jgi:hypothetical protein
MSHALITVAAVAVTAAIVWRLARRPVIAELSEEDRATLEDAHAEAAAARDAAEHTRRQLPELARMVVEMNADLGRAIVRTASKPTHQPARSDVARPAPRMQTPAKIAPGTAPIRAARPTGRVSIDGDPTVYIAAVPASAGQCSPPAGDGGGTAVSCGE